MKYVNGVYKSSETETRELTHCNWGWNGKQNGFFIPGTFDSNNPIISTRQTTTGTDYYYAYKKQMWRGIRWD